MASDSGKVSNQHSPTMQIGSILAGNTFNEPAYCTQTAALKAVSNAYEASSVPTILDIPGGAKSECPGWLMLKQLERLPIA